MAAGAAALELCCLNAQLWPLRSPPSSIGSAFCRIPTQIPMHALPVQAPPTLTACRTTPAGSPPPTIPMVRLTDGLDCSCGSAHHDCHHQHCCNHEQQQLFSYTIQRHLTCTPFLLTTPWFTPVHPPCHRIHHRGHPGLGSSRTRCR